LLKVALNTITLISFWIGVVYCFGHNLSSFY
jgi:hypothetical protein